MHPLWSAAVLVGKLGFKLTLLFIVDLVRVLRFGSDRNDL